MKTLIISGAGTIAGTYLYNQFLGEIINASDFKNDCDFPEIVLHNYPFKCIKTNGDLDKKLAKKEIQKIVKTHKADVVMIACNTMHTLDLNITGLVSLPGNALTKFLTDNIANKKCLVLCSRESKKENLFSLENVDYLPEELQVLCDEWIEENIFKPTTHKNVATLKEYMAFKGYTHLIVGCTELSLIDWTPLNVVVIDGLTESIKTASKIILGA